MTTAVVIRLDKDILFVQFDKIAAVAADGHVSALNETVQTLRSLFARCDSIDSELRTCKHVTSDKDVGLGGLVSEFVCNGIDATEELNLRIFQEIFQHHGLTDGKDNPIGL